jgi:hypothetical protein
MIEIAVIALLLWRFRETRYSVDEKPQLVPAA